MIGAIAGDIIGSVYEHHPIKTKEFSLFHPQCRFTDDTVLTVALADTLLTGTPYVANLKTYHDEYPDRGYGRSFRHWARSPSQTPYGSWGNGAAMRISPVGYAFDDLDTVLHQAEAFTAVTHNHPEGIKGAQAVATAIFLARSGESRDSIRATIESRFGYDLSQHTDAIRPDYAFDVSAAGTVPQAIRAFLDSTDFEDAIRIAISLGGDADTLACITGGIAQAFYRNVPNAIQVAVYRILDDRLGLTVLRFMQRYAEFCCETSALDASLTAGEEEMRELLKELPEVTEDPDALFSRYSFRFHVGDIVYLKTGADFAQSLERMQEYLKEDGLPPDISWVPDPEWAATRRGVPMTVVMTNAYHFGYPLYFVVFRHQRRNYEYRICEAFLTAESDPADESQVRDRYIDRRSV